MIAYLVEKQDYVNNKHEYEYVNPISSDFRLTHWPCFCLIRDRISCPESNWIGLSLKVSKSQKHFFLKLHCPKKEQNIRQNSALESRIG